MSTIVKFYDSADDSLLKFAVIIARKDDRWVFCKHRDRDTFGCLYHADIFEP